MFDEGDDVVSLCIQYPEPQALLNLAAWQDYSGFDRGGRQARLAPSFNPDTLELALEVDGEIPHALPVEELHDEVGRTTPGPAELRSGSQMLRFHAGILKL